MRPIVVVLLCQGGNLDVLDNLQNMTSEDDVKNKFTTLH